MGCVQPSTGRLIAVFCEFRDVFSSHHQPTSLTISVTILRQTDFESLILTRYDSQPPGAHLCSAGSALQFCIALQRHRAVSQARDQENQIYSPADHGKPWQ